MKDLLRQALSHCDVDYCEIRLEESDTTTIAYRGLQLETCERTIASGGNVRALFKGGWGFVSFNELSDLPGKVRLACQQARILGTMKGDDSRLAPLPPIEDEVPLQVEIDPRSVPLADKVSLLEQYNRLMLDFDPVIRSTNIRYFDKYSHVTFASTDGSHIIQERSDLGCNLMPVATDGKLTTTRAAATGGSSGFQVMYGLEDKIRQACRVTVDLLAAPPVRGGQYTVVLDPDLAGVFIHEAFGHLSEADGVADNENMKKLMTLGAVFGPPFLNVYDSGLEAGHRGAARYDDEGTPTGKTALIERGVLVGRLHSRESAGKMGEKPTGNARALDYRFPPICRMRTTYIAPGDTPFGEMIKDIPLGVYAVGSYGGQTNGEMFTFTAGEAYMIRDGKIAELVRDVTLTGNLMTTLKNIDRIGSNLCIHNSAGGCGKGAQAPLATSTGSPPIRIQNVIIGGVK